MWLAILTVLEMTPLGWLGHKTATQTRLYKEWPLRAMNIQQLVDSTRNGPWEQWTQHLVDSTRNGPWEEWTYNNYSGTLIIQSPRDQTVLFELETLNNWELKCIHIFRSGLQNDFELSPILNYWSLNYRGSTVIDSTRNGPWESWTYNF